MAVAHLYNSTIFPATADNYTLLSLNLSLIFLILLMFFFSFSVGQTYVNMTHDSVRALGFLA